MNLLYSCAIALGTVGVFILVLCAANTHLSDTAAVVGLVLALCAGTFAAHWLLVKPGLAAWWAPTLGWALCVIPLYVYSYHIARSGFFGKSFTFVAIGLFVVLPPGVLALILALVHLARRVKG